MKQTLENYCREVEEKAEKFALTEQTCRQDDHLRSFNFGRMVGRTEISRHAAWVHFGWLVAGILIGAACGLSYPDHAYAAMAHKILTHVDVFVKGAGRLGFGGGR